LPGNSSVNTVQHTIIEVAVFSVSSVTSHNRVYRPRDVFSVDSIDAPTDRLDSDHVTCVYCRTMSVPLLYKAVTEFVEGSYELRVSRKLGE
jgi:hypothetical protein